MTITSTSIYSRKTGKLITASYEPSQAAIEKVAQVALALAMTASNNLASALASKSYNEAVIIDKVEVK